MRFDLALDGGTVADHGLHANLFIEIENIQLISRQKTKELTVDPGTSK
jgi:hypothetical protein